MPSFLDAAAAGQRAYLRGTPFHVHVDVAAQEPVLAASTILSEELGPVYKPTYGLAIVACGTSLARKASAGLLRGHLDRHLDEHL